MLFTLMKGPNSCNPLWQIFVPVVWDKTYGNKVITPTDRNDKSLTFEKVPRAGYTREFGRRLRSLFELHSRKHYRDTIKDGRRVSGSIQTYVSCDKLCAREGVPEENEVVKGKSYQLWLTGGFAGSSGSSVINWDGIPKPGHLNLVNSPLLNSCVLMWLSTSHSQIWFNGSIWSEISIDHWNR